MVKAVSITFATALRRREINGDGSEWHLNLYKSVGHLLFVFGAGFIHQVVLFRASLLHAGFVAVRTVADDVGRHRAHKGRNHLQNVRRQLPESITKNGNGPITPLWTGRYDREGLKGHATLAAAVTTFEFVRHLFHEKARESKSFALPPAGPPSRGKRRS
jgi:hypothetical protein